MLIEPLSEHHNRLAFACGNDKLDRYLHESAHQAKRKGLAATFVATDPAGNPSNIIGYYALSSFMISGVAIPDALRRKRKLPSHQIGATLLGRLAVARDMQRRGIGTLLLAAALRRSYSVSSDVASVGVVVDAIEKSAVAYYREFGFEIMNDGDLRMVLMMDSIAQLLPGVSTSAKTRQSPDAQFLG